MTMRGRPTSRVVLDNDQRRELQRLGRSRKNPDRLVQRARIVLACADGLPDRQVAARLGIDPKTVAIWRKRFLEGGVAALYDKPRTGRPNRISGEDVRTIVAKTLSSAPAGSRRWTATAMAAATGWHEGTIRRVWCQCGLHPDRLLCVGFSADLWEYGTWSLVGVFRHFGQKAIAISVDARWRNEVSPFVWRQEPPHRRSIAPIAPHSPRYHDVHHKRENPSAFGDFLDAVIPNAHEGRVLFLLVNSSRLHQLALMKQWRLGRNVMCISRADDADTWHRAAGSLAGMMAAREKECGDHGDGGQLFTLLAGPERGYTAFANRHERHHEGSSCRCAPSRRRRSLEQRNLVKAQMRGPKSRRRCRYHRRFHQSNCWNCCLRRYQDQCRSVIAEWRHEVGDGKVVRITLTYRASSDLEPKEWLERAHRDLNSLRARWRRIWMSMPPYLVAWEFTAKGTPHLNLVIPWESDEHLAVLRQWLPGCWASIVGAGRHWDTVNPYAVDFRVQGVDAAVRYALKLIAVPRNRWPVPPGTPSFRSWERSRRWERAQPATANAH